MTTYGDADSCQEDIFEKIGRISDKYIFYGQRPTARQEEEGQQIIAEEQYIEPNLFFSFKKLKGKICDQLLNAITYKNQILETNTLRVLKEALEGYKFLSVVKFEFCRLTHEQITVIDNLLTCYNTIEELSMNGNSINETEFYLVCRHNLKVLSLKLCGINNDGALKLCKELSTAYDNCLLHLNLSSNVLFDEGAVHFANMLRLNRKLISLNLADNKISDEGLLTLLKPLQKFELNLDELINRRQLKLDFHKKLMGATLNVKVVSSRNYVKQKQRFVSASSSVIVKKGKPARSSISSRAKPSIGPAAPTSAIQLPEHPLLKDSIEENEYIYCIGNNVLNNFNLAYNRITDKVVPDIITMLDYQMSRLEICSENGKTGLSRLSLVGNKISTDALQDIKTCLQDKPCLTI